MNKQKLSTRNDILYIITLLLSIYFAGTFWFWTYYINLFFSLPAGVIAFILYLLLNKWGYFKTRLNILLFIMLAGILFSVGTALLMQMV
ncbi:MAG: hypothetical protein ACPGLV_08335 [Bacteroidia bacterium]